MQKEMYFTETELSNIDFGDQFYKAPFDTATNNFHLKLELSLPPNEWKKTEELIWFQ